MALGKKMNSHEKLDKIFNLIGLLIGLVFKYIWKYAFDKAPASKLNSHNIFCLYNWYDIYNTLYFAITCIKIIIFK